MSTSIIGKIISFILKAYKEGANTMQPSEKEIINWMGKESYNRIMVREGKDKANEIFYLVKQGKVDPEEYAGIRKPGFKYVPPEKWREMEDDC